jgi:glucose/mannose-6-phosphate isomerase
MRKAIENFQKQFAWNPVVENASEKISARRFVVAGMGGSHLAADLLRGFRPEIPLVVHSDYGLPHVPEEDIAETLFIISSYSGNTEETLDAFDAARSRGFNLCAIASGGELIIRAKKERVPYVEIPNTGIQPRSALGYSLRALLAVMGDEELLNRTEMLASSLSPLESEAAGRDLAHILKGFVPVICASARNSSLAYNWKIKFNETGKIPAFYNIFPEINHNEMTGFDVKDSTRPLSHDFHFIFLKDPDDDARIRRRMEVAERLYRDRKLPVKTVELSGPGRLEKIFSSLILADWTAFFTAENYGVEPEKVPMVEEFKKIIAQ